MLNFRPLAALLLCIMLTGCGDDSPEQPAAATAPPAPAPQPLPAPDVKLEYTLEFSTDAKSNSVTWTARVPTGGWKLTTDKVLVEDDLGKTSARIWAILEQPAPDEMTTQAFETLTGTHNAGATKLDKAELSIKRIVRGQKYDTPALYAIVKHAG
jgi:hypothetical protein